VKPRAFTRRLRFWQKKMLLSGWKIAVEFGPLDHAERAECEAKPEYREALIKIDLPKVSDEEIDAYCVHELLHCWTWPLEKLAENWAFAKEDDQLYESIRDTAENVVTDIERAILNIAGT
jgi:hypothetical protein